MTWHTVYRLHTHRQTFGLYEPPEQLITKPFQCLPNEGTNKDILEIQGTPFQLLAPAEDWCPLATYGLTNQYKIFKNCSDAVNKSKMYKNVYYLDKSSFKKLQEISFDYAILEKSKNINGIKLNIPLIDLGNWKEIWNFFKKHKTKSKNLKHFQKTYIFTNSIHHSFYHH